MRIRSPSLSELHAFVAVVETGGFTRAAQRLVVSQGAVSRAVLRLEEHLGMTLFERGPAGVQPSAAAQAYYERVQPAITALEDAVPAAARGRAALAPRPLRVCAIPSLNMRWLVPRLASFHAAHPGLQVVFKPYWKDDDFQREEVDCWIQTRPSANARWPRHVTARYLIGREIVPICHPSLAARIRTPADLLRQPLLFHSNYPDNWALWFKAQGVDTRGLALGAGFDLAAGLIEAVASGLGVAVVQVCLFERERAEGRVVVPLALPVSTGRGYYLVRPKARPETPALAAFADWLLAQPDD
ncbi:MAG: LysR family transcriptional regulator [Burkholderiales bacterium]|nr:LysR family transcriptional regulator [Burkholderiales bacterium]